MLRELDELQYKEAMKNYHTDRIGGTWNYRSATCNEPQRWLIPGWHVQGDMLINEWGASTAPQLVSVEARALGCAHTQTTICKALGDVESQECWNAW